MSDKNKIKERLKKPSATQAFFNSYDQDIVNNNETNKDEVEDNNENVNETENIVDVEVNHNNDNNQDDVTYVIDDNVVNVGDDDDYLRSLAVGKKATRKKNKKVFTSFYMEPDLAREVDKIASRGAKGDKSKLINTAIRKLLEEYGVIERNN
ncbi:ribbon-helix-helix domain-containing protein [Bacillus dakarensis]|uniref:ribbon-helix-helix domain-containing protein n=1 Tax=Robertmurraya dakarensis TaxID=1926278 RepID=UPI000980EC64|nr:ribbon-helix-helix domain-containing protein [Bacillus dakarensis]